MNYFTYLLAEQRLNKNKTPKALTV